MDRDTEETLTHVRTTIASHRRLQWQWQTPDLPAALKADEPIQPPLPQVTAAQLSQSAVA